MPEPDLMAQVKRERGTTTKVQKMDTSDVVAMIHEMEDQIARLKARASAIADDFHPSSPAENALALSEMREAIAALAE